MQSKVFWLLKLISASILLLLCVEAWSIDVPDLRLPGGAEASQASNRLSTGSFSRHYKEGAMVKAVTPKALAPTPGGGGIHFKLNKVILTGNRVISTEKLSEVYKNLLNKEISLNDLNKIAEEITRKYRSEGYILSRAILPPQVIHDGIVRIQVVEGFIDKVSVGGKPGRLKRLAQRYGEKAAKDRPLRIQTLERYVLLLDDIAGTDVRAVLTPSKTTPGAADLVLLVDLKYIQADFNYDNFGTAYLGPEQITIDGQLNSAIFAGDKNLARFVVTTQTRELKFVNFDHSQPISVYGTQWTLGGSYTETHPGFLLEPLEVHGISKLAYTGLNHPIIRSRGRNLYLHGFFNYQENYSTILKELLYYDHIRSAQIGLNYDSVDEIKGLNNIVFDIEQGLPILGYSKANAPFLSRANGRSVFTKFNLNASRLQYFGSRFSLLGALEGQYSCQPLLAAEEFAFGGPIFGRGYDPSELTGDDGIAGKIEARVDTPMDWMFFTNMQFYTFYDAGKVWNIGPNNTQLTSLSADSLGAGARLFFKRILFVNFYAAKPLSHGRFADIAVGKNGRNMQYYIQASMNFY